MSWSIPSKLNTLLVFGVFLSQNLLLVLGNYLGGFSCFLCAILFSFLFLTNYALMHEGSHRMLHKNHSVNDALGLITGIFFPASFTLMRVTHIVHHCCNRTDHEMFDYYYKGDRIWLKYLQWYSILFGLFWLIIPLGSVIVGFWRSILLTKPFKSSRSSSVLFDDFSSSDIRRVRIEVLVTLSYFSILVLMMNISWVTFAVFYACSAFNWSTRQYITHAWSVRNVMDGAHNLKVSKLHQLFLLNGNWDLVHHNHPDAPWLYLPILGIKSKKPISSWYQYLSLWKGPKLTTERTPEPLSVLPTNLH